MSEVSAYAAQDPEADLKPFDIERREVTAEDVQIEIEYCGVCHSDIHQVRDDWNNSMYPVVPGHEIIGRVTETGSDVSDFEEGDLVGVGCMVDSCQTCPSCQQDLRAILRKRGSDDLQRPR
ncbi:MAG: alcohol dehydrogenase catalytic domain-containing protein [Fodinibius sp.]|nr:alcohol dehydrogenase catalytic domain-containing protein [Fodinibius sp.]